MTNRPASANTEIVSVVELPEVSSQFAGKNSGPLLMLDLRDIRDIIFVEDMNFNVLYASPSVRPMFGYTEDEIKALAKSDFMTPDSLNRAMESFQKYCALSQKQIDFDIPLMEFEYVRKDGSTFWGELKVNFIRDSEGQFIGSQGILRDIDGRKKMEKNLRQSENKFRTFFDLSPQAVALTEIQTGKLIDVNDKFCELTQYDKKDLIGKTTTDLELYSIENRAQFLAELHATGQVQRLEMDFRIKSGSTINALMFSRKIEVDNQELLLNVCYNKTNEKRLERQFLQAQKMESIGTLASSIIHDFNNCLQGINGNITLMSFEMDALHPSYPKLNAINDLVNSCTQLTQQLLEYASKEKYDYAPFDVNRLVKEAAYSLKGRMQNISVHEDLEPEIMLVEGDAVQIKQLLYNLYLNAADAMPQGGELILKTSNVSYKDMADRAYRPEKKMYVCMIIADNGVGMNQTALDHLFEPFFTTKGKSKGTGLGLSSVYGIVKGHGGYIDVDSQPGRGTTFSIYFPADAAAKELGPLLT